MNPGQELLDTIEQIRKQKFSEVPEDLVRQIVTIETDFTDNRQEAYKRISQAIDDHLGTDTPATKAEM
jgi:hypothetical protein